MLKKLTKYIFDKTLFRIIKYINYHLSDSNSQSPKSLYYRLRENAITESIEFVELNLDKVLFFPYRNQLYDYLISKLKSQEGLFLEFGVFKGVSINYFSNQLKNKHFHGFDSFIGLKEDWKGTKSPVGRFNLFGKLPKVNSNVTLIAGWFDEVLPKFLDTQKSHIAFLHIDSDTYESAVIILEALGNRLKKNSIVLFDEFHGYPNWKNGEFKAWNEFVDKNKIRYEFLAFSNEQCALIIL